MKTFKDFKEGVNRAQQAAIAISKKKSGKYDKDGKRIKEAQGPCWDGYEQRGMKKKGGKMVPNCVPVNEKMNPRDHVKKKDDKYVIVAPSGKVVKTFDDKKDAEDWIIKNHDSVMKEVKQDSEIKDKEGTQPAKYYAGDMAKSTKDKRAAHFAKKKSGPAPGDASAKTKPSVHTKKYKQMFGEAIEGLKNKAEKSGMPYGILKKVYDRGMAAYKTGHRPGTTAQQWAFARVNSFVTKSKGTWGGADKDLAAKVRG